MMSHLDLAPGVHEIVPSRAEQRASERARRGATARNQSTRRRFVDPATCEREYSGPELEFLHAMQEYKRASGRLFPTWSEVLEVVRDLGYVKADA
jgi:hypothetical protein